LKEERRMETEEKKVWNVDKQCSMQICLSGCIEMLKGRNISDRETGIALMKQLFEHLKIVKNYHDVGSTKDILDKFFDIWIVE
jgi:hypothetical protein